MKIHNYLKVLFYLMRTSTDTFKTYALYTLEKVVEQRAKKFWDRGNVTHFDQEKIINLTLSL